MAYEIGRKKKYDLDIDIDGLIESTPKFVAGLKLLPELVEIDKEMKETDSSLPTVIGAVLGVILSLIDS